MRQHLSRSPLINAIKLSIFYCVWLNMVTAFGGGDGDFANCLFWKWMLHLRNITTDTNTLSFLWGRFRDLKDMREYFLSKLLLWNFSLQYIFIKIEKIRIRKQFEIQLQGLHPHHLEDSASKGKLPLQWSNVQSPKT